MANKPRLGGRVRVISGDPGLIGREGTLILREFLRDGRQMVTLKFDKPDVDGNEACRVWAWEIEAVAKAKKTKGE
jgi:hypothetical protein